MHVNHARESSSVRADAGVGIEVAPTRKGRVSDQSVVPERGRPSEWDGHQGVDHITGRVVGVVLLYRNEAIPGHVEGKVRVPKRRGFRCECHGGTCVHVHHAVMKRYACHGALRNTHPTVARYTR